MPNTMPEPELTAHWAGIDAVPFAPGARSSQLFESSYVLEYCHHGRGRITMNDRTYQIECGECFFTFPGVLATFEADENTPWQKSWISFSGTGVANHLAAMGITADSPVVPIREYTSLLESIRSYIDVINDTSAGLRAVRFNQNMCANHVFSLLMAVCGMEFEQGESISPREKYVQTAVRYIENSVNNGEDVSVNRVAAHVGLNRTYFSTLFKQIAGKTVQKYVIDARMSRARTLLENPMATVSNVASALGYEPAPFCRIFKKVTGSTPLEYKLSLDKNRQY